MKFWDFLRYFLQKYPVFFSSTCHSTIRDRYRRFHSIIVKSTACMWKIYLISDVTVMSSPANNVMWKNISIWAKICVSSEQNTRNAEDPLNCECVWWKRIEAKNPFLQKRLQIEAERKESEQEGNPSNFELLSLSLQVNQKNNKKRKLEIVQKKIKEVFLLFLLAVCNIITFHGHIGSTSIEASEK